MGYPTTMTDQKLTLEQKKEKLENELKELQSELENSLSDLKGDVKDSFKPKNLIRKYPLTSLGICLIAGFIIAGRKNEYVEMSDKGKSGPKGSGTTFVQTPPGVTSMFMLELKRAITQKATSHALRYLDDIFEKKFNRKESDE
jgi:hypothetical protein